MLNRVEKVLSNPDLEHRRALYVAMHELAVERFPESVDEVLPFNQRARSRLLRAGDYDALAALAEFERDLRAQARAVELRAADGGVELRVEAELEGLWFERAGERVVWAAGRSDATDALAGSTVQLLLKQRSSQEEYRLPATVERRLVDGPDGRVRAVVTVTGRVDAAKAAAGAPLPPGLWEVHAMVIIVGFRAAGRVRRATGSEHLMLAVADDGRVSERRPGWQRNLRRRTPRAVVHAIRAAQRAVRRRVRR
jgi:polyribitol phosphate beta-O-GlcNActransferase TarS-like protein